MLDERPPTPEDIGVDSLTELALNLRSSWHHGADELWNELDPELWSLTHNPRVVLQTVSRTKLRELLARPDYRRRVAALLERQRQHLASTAWFQQSHPRAPLTRVACSVPSGCHGSPREP